MAQSKYWCFTLNNYTQDEEKAIRQLETTYLIYGRERGEGEGTPHLQGYLELSSRKRLSTVKRMLGLRRAHLERRLGTSEEAAEYCKKDGDFFESGVRSVSKQGKRTDLDEIKEYLDGGGELVGVASISFGSFVRYYSGFEKYIHLTRKVGDLPGTCGVWVYGPPGVGKSFKVRAENPGFYEKDPNKWWNGYQGEDVVIMEDLDMRHEHLGWFMKRWPDAYSFQAQSKNGYSKIRPKKIIVTSNYQIKDIWGADPILTAAIERRFKIIHCPVRMY
jgi:hypothetical protein